MDQTQVSHIADRFFTSWVTREALGQVKQLSIMQLIGPKWGLIDNMVRYVDFTNEDKITLICKIDQIAQMASCYITGAYLLRAVKPPDSKAPATWSSPQSSLVWYKKDSIRKGGHWFSLRANHLLFPSNKFPFSCLTTWLALFFSAIALQQQTPEFI